MKWTLLTKNTGSLHAFTVASIVSRLHSRYEMRRRNMLTWNMKSACCLFVLSLMVLSVGHDTAHAQKTKSTQVKSTQAKSTQVKSTQVKSTQTTLKPPHVIKAPQVYDRESTFHGIQSWQMGVFNPVYWQWHSKWALEVHPLSFWMMPHVDFIHTWWETQRARLHLIYGLSDPSWALTHAPPFGVQGFLSPSCKVSDQDTTRPATCQQSGQALVPKLGFKWSIREHKRIWTLKADWSIGFMLNGSRPQPLQTYAPIEIKFAALTHRHRTHWGVRLWQQLTRSWGIAGEFDTYLLGSQSLHSPWIFSAYLGTDYAFSTHHSMTLGLMYWNSDQGAIQWSQDADGWSSYQSVRSHDFYPCLDFIWRY